MKLHNLFVSLVIIVAGAAHAAPPTSTAFVLNDHALPATSSSAAASLSRAVRSAGYRPVYVTADDLLAPGRLNLSVCRLLVLPRCRSLPSVLAPVIDAYLKAGGHLLAVGAPAWADPLVRGDGGGWVSLKEYGAKRALEPPARTLFRFDGSVVDWRRASDHPDAPATYETVTVEANGHRDRALHAVVSNLQGWDTLASPPAAVTLFGPGETATVFSAKGGPRTRALALEWEEKDHSRWIATVALTERWQRYSLPPSAFHNWQNNPDRAAQGFHPENAQSFHIGLAYTHTGQMSGRHEYWISSTGVSPEAAGGPDLTAEMGRIRPIDTLSPKYKFYQIHGRASLTADSGQSIVAINRLLVPSGSMLQSSSPRPSGTGFNKGRTWRWIPLVRASDAATGAYRGSPATLMLHAAGDPYPGSAWLVLGEMPDTLLSGPPLRNAITNALKRMRDGAFLLEAGSEYFCYEPGDVVRLGARVFSVAANHDQLKLRIRVTDLSGHIAAKHDWPIAMTASPEIRQWRWRPPAHWPSGGYVVTSLLLRGGIVIDRLQHELNLYAPDEVPNYIAAKPDGHFYLNNRLWRINGVNYMPSSGIGQEDPHLFEYWLSREAYDPEIIERDLQQIERLGMNAISIFVYRESLESHNLIDVLRRCKIHHLHVNLSLRPGVLNFLQTTSQHPKEDALENFTTIVKRYRLWRDDTIFAFETAWEPNFGNQLARKIMDPDWRLWINRVYGNINSAEAAWGCGTPRNDAGDVTNPSGPQMAGDDKAAFLMVRDYRRFLDSWLNATYGAATHAIKALAPHQMVSFRMASTGYPSDDQRTDLPYQFEGLVHAVDFLSPECYGRVGSEEGEQGILFEAAYARAVGPKLPQIWAETGFTAWDPAAQQNDPGALDFQGRYISTFYRLAVQSGADGVFFWWYPGGFRTGEESDYGILNPDGTSRQSTNAILTWGKRLLNQGFPPQPDIVFDFDRELYADGIHGVYGSLKAPFVKALKAGKRPGLRANRKSGG